jgi:alanine racemase
VAAVTRSAQVRTASSTRPNEAFINLDAVRFNTRAVLRSIQPAAVLAAVKADAYGHGALEVAREATAAGAIGAATGDLDTALRLRQGGLSGMIVVFPGPVFTTADLRAAASASVTLTAHDAATAAYWSKSCPAPLEIFMKISLGLERLGFYPEEAPSIAQQLQSSACLTITGVLGHLHAPIDASTEYVQWQLDRFAMALDSLAASGPLPVHRIVAASSALRRRADLRFDQRLTAVDPGSILLGSAPPEHGLLSEVRPALERIATQLVQVRRVSRAAYADDGPFPVSPGMRVGILPIGRADGLPSIGAGHVLVGGRPARIIRIWTEHTAINLTDLPSAEPGEEVVLFGPQGDSTITVGDIAAVNPDTNNTVDIGVSLRHSVLRSYIATRSENETAQTANYKEEP